MGLETKHAGKCIVKAREPFFEPFFGMVIFSRCVVDLLDGWWQWYYDPEKRSNDHHFRANRKAISLNGEETWWVSYCCLFLFAPITLDPLFDCCLYRLQRFRTCQEWAKNLSWSTPMARGRGWMSTQHPTASVWLVDNPIPWRIDVSIL